MRNGAVEGKRCSLDWPPRGIILIGIESSGREAAVCSVWMIVRQHLCSLRWTLGGSIHSKRSNLWHKRKRKFSQWAGEGVRRGEAVCCTCRQRCRLSICSYFGRLWQILRRAGMSCLVCWSAFCFSTPPQWFLGTLSMLLWATHLTKFAASQPSLATLRGSGAVVTLIPQLLLQSSPAAWLSQEPKLSSCSVLKSSSILHAS